MTRAGAVRRRRAAVLAAGAAAFAAGALLGGGGDDRPALEPRAGERRPPAAGASPAPDAVATSPAPPAAGRLGVRALVGQAIVLRFAGTRAPAYVRRALREERAAGVILFRDNVASPGQLRALTRSLRRAARGGGREPGAAQLDPIVAVDQEGGAIRILPWAPPRAAAPEQAAAGRAGADARAAGRALRAAGVTVALAPVADVPSVGDAALAGRAFSRDPRAVADAAAQAVAGWRAAGVAATAKHFPGLGGATVNTDFGTATVRRSEAQLARVDLPPFRAAIAAGVPLVMVGHARYPALDRARIASQSAPILRGLLRGRLGYRGVIVTDSMEAAASLATGPLTTAAERALRAGADLLLLTGRGSFAPVSAHLAAQARRSPALRSRLREAAGRVRALRRAGPEPPSGDTSGP